MDTPEAFRYSGREQAFRRYVEGEVGEGDLTTIQEFLRYILENEMWDLPHGGQSGVAKQFEIAMDAQLHPRDEVKVKLAEELPTEIQDAADNALFEILEEINDRLVIRLRESAFGIELPDLNEVDTEGLVGNFMRALEGAQDDQGVFENRLRKAVAALDTTIRSYVENQLRRAGFDLTVPSNPAPPSEQGETSPFLAKHFAVPAQREVPRVDNPPGEDIPF